MPAALPPFVAGLKQGWAFAWHGLFAGELLVIVPNSPSIGVLLSSDQDQTDMAGVISIMIVILVLGVAVDIAVQHAERIDPPPPRARPAPGHRARLAARPRRRQPRDDRAPACRRDRPVAYVRPL